MAEKKYEDLTSLSEGYKVVTGIGEDGRRTREIVVVNAQGEVVQQVSQGKQVPNSHLINSADLNYSAAPFESGVATIDYVAPMWGQGLQNGGESITLGLTRSGYTVYREEISEIRNVFNNPEVLKKIKLPEIEYSRKYKLYLDVAQHAFERKGNEFASNPKALEELIRLAKNVVSHLAKEFEKNNKKGSVGIIERIAKLTDQSADVTLVSGGE